MCGFAHIPLGSSDELFDAFGDYIRYGRPPKKTEACAMEGTSFSIEELPTGPASTSSARPGGLSGATRAALRQAYRAGKADVITLPGQTIVVTDARNAARIALPASRLLVTARQLRGTRAGAPRSYGPLVGKLVLGTTKQGASVVTLNGRKARRRRR